MYQVLIVDDEKLIRNGLSRHFDWQHHGLEVCGTADNGISAKNFVEQNHVDLVITDVCMPQMSGIELAQWLRENYPGVQILFISGYEDLDYLKAALKVDAVDYIMKSVDFDELAQAVDTVVQRIETENRKKRHLSRLEQHLNKSLPILKERLLTVLIRDDVIADEFYDNQIRFLELPLSSSREYTLLVIRILNFYANYSKKTERERQLYCMMIYENVEECIVQEKEVTVFSNTADELVCVLPSDGGIEHAKVVSQRIIDSLSDNMNVRARIGVSRPFMGYPQMKSGYEEALQALSEEASLEQIMLSGQMEEEKGSYAYVEKLLTAAVNEGDETHIDRIGEFLHGISDRHELEHYLFYLMILASRIRYDNAICSTQEHYRRLKRQFEGFFASSSGSTMLESGMKDLKRLLKDIREKRSRQSNASVVAVKKYIAAHLEEPLTLVELASSVYLTPAYLCQLFKRETGRNLSDYITRKRIEKAKELLIQPEIKLYDICTRVGLVSVSYFSKLFKKHTGMTPSQYRQVITKQHSDDEEA